MPIEEATTRKAHTLQLVRSDRSMFNFQNFPERTKSPDNNFLYAIQPHWASGIGRKPRT